MKTGCESERATGSEGRAEKKMDAWMAREAQPKARGCVMVVRKGARCAVRDDGENSGVLGRQTRDDKGVDSRRAVPSRYEAARERESV